MSIDKWLSNFASETPEDLLEHLRLGPPQSFPFSRCEARAGICISKQFPGEAVTAGGPGTTLCEPLI